jgi:hypothetical protein
MPWSFPPHVGSVVDLSDILAHLGELANRLTYTLDLCGNPHVGQRDGCLSRGHLEALRSCFDAWSGQNWFRVAGFNLLGVRFWGAGATAWSQRRFDRRFDTGADTSRNRRLLPSLGPSTVTGPASADAVQRTSTMMYVFVVAQPCTASI